MTTILVWQQYGNPRAFSANTRNELLAIMQIVKDYVTPWGPVALQEAVAAMDLVVNAATDTRASFVIDRFVKANCRDHESFELFKFQQLEIPIIRP